MENNIALTLREVADQVNKETEEKKMALHREFVETMIVPYLQEEARKGRYQTKFIISDYSNIIVRDLLRELGFTVDVFKYSDGYYLVVKW